MNYNQTAMTSLAIMAMAAVGHQPSDRASRAPLMKKALSFVLRPDRREVQGYFGGRDGSRMYGHGITTLMLSEMLGMGVDAQMDQVIRDRCRLAVEMIKAGPGDPQGSADQGRVAVRARVEDSDLSITVWQVMALRSARNAGMDVPKELIDNAVDYIKRCYSSKRGPDGKPENLKSGCGYEPSRAPEYAMAAAGLLSLQVCGAYESPEAKGSTDWLKERKLEYGTEWFFYGTYYYAQGMF